jgi:hypothetical protein
MIRGYLAALLATRHLRDVARDFLGELELQAWVEEVAGGLEHFSEGWV